MSNNVLIDNILCILSPDACMQLRQKLGTSYQLLSIRRQHGA